MNKLKYGFTLVELLIVMTILSILSTLAFVSFQSYVTMGKEAKKTTEIKRITTAIEITKEGNNFLPIPDSSTQIVSTGSGWVSGILGENVRRQLGLDRVPYDEQFGANYTYSTFDKKYYEIGTVVTQSSNFSSLSPKAQATDLKAKIEGNYNGFFLKYNSGGLTYYISTPSVTLSNPSEGIQANQLTDNIVINGEENLPYTYAQVLGETGTGKLFTPKILWSGTDCGPTTASEIKDFVENLQLSFTGLSQEMYSSLQSKQTYEEKLEYGVNVINTYGNCKIEKPKVLPSVSLLSCGGKDLSFEGYASGALLTDDCLFDMTGNGKWQIVNGGSAGQRSLRSIFANGESGSIIYKTQITTPMIFSFDYLRNNENRVLNFYVNNNLIADTNNHSSWTTISTVPLPPGEYEFRFEFATDFLTKYVILDNLRFENVGLSYGFEKSSGDNLDLSFNGNTPRYLYSLSKTEGQYSMKVPLKINTNTVFSFTKNVGLDTLMSFDYYGGGSNMNGQIFVNGIFLTSLGNTNNWKKHNILLQKNSINTIEFHFNKDFPVKFLLFDNITFQNPNFDSSFELNGTGDTIGVTSSGTWFLSETASNGLFGLKSGDKLSQINITKTLTQTGILSFDYTLQRDNVAYVSINGLRSIELGHSNLGSPVYTTMKTQPLPPGDYEFNFYSSDLASWDARFYLDNIKFEYLDINSSFEPVAVGQGINFSFSGSYFYLDHRNKTEGNFSLRSSHGRSSIEFTRNFTSSQQMIFDYRVQRDNQCGLFINGIRQTMGCDIPNMTTYTSSVIPPGIHTIRFESFDDKSWDSFFILDNIRFQ